MRAAYQVLWWVPEGAQPDLREARERLAHLRSHGPSEHAFTFRKAFPAPDGGPDPARDQRLAGGTS